MKIYFFRRLTVMAIKDTFKTLRELLSQIVHDLEKSENGNKAASQRVRTGTVKLEKVAKLFRKESIKNEKATKGQKKPAKKATKAKSAAKSHAHHAHHAHHAAHGAKSAKVKAKPKAKSHKSTARPRALSLKKPTAKLPKKSHRR